MRTSAEARPRPSAAAAAEPLRILFLCGEYPLVGGGIGAYVKSLAPALAARGHEVHVLSCLGGQRRRDYRDGPVLVHERGKVTLRLGVRRPLGGPEAWDRLVTAVSCRLEQARLGVPFDVVEVADFGAEGLLLGPRGRVVAHLHGPLRLTNHYNGFERGRDVRLADWLERMAVARADLLTAPSDLVSRRLREAGWLRRPARTIRNPIDLELWEAVAPLGDARHRPLVLAVGRVEPLKGSDVLVRAAALLARKAGEVEVVFVGRSSGERDGMPYRDWVQKLSAELGAPCRFVEQVPRSGLPGWYAAARVVAVPSHYDTFPMGGLEAMASGRPVVCSSGTGLAELVEGSGAGAVVPSGDADLLARALLPYVLDPEVARAAGDHARRLVRAACSPQRIAEEREGCYRGVLRAW
jgi:glycosyltransferase involved in cell wall biosynthesis